LGQERWLWLILSQSLLNAGYAKRHLAQILVHVRKVYLKTNLVAGGNAGFGIVLAERQPFLQASQSLI